MATIRAPKQWPLTKQETITSFEAWRQNLQYTLSLDRNFANFLVDGFTWYKKTNAEPLRGLADDAETVPEASRRTAAQKITHLELMLGQIANFCPVISRNTIVKNSTSLISIWQAIRMHYGFQSTGGHFLEFSNIRLEPGERPEDLFQRLMSFVEDNLLRADGAIRHHGDLPPSDEELSPTLENFVVLTWLRLINTDLPALVKQRYGTELRSQTLATLKPEISQALDSLLDEVHAAKDAKVLRAAFRKQSIGKPPAVDRFHGQASSRQTAKVCPLCKQAGRPNVSHFLSMCKFLPEEDKRFMTKARQTISLEDCSYTEDEECYDNSSHTNVETEKPLPSNQRAVSLTLCVSTKQSPYMKAFHKHHPVQLTLDTGAEISMIKSSTASLIGAPIQKSTQNALQADGITPLHIVGETRLTLTRDNIDLHLEALVVNDLDVDVLAGIPFMTANDISVRPSKHQIVIGETNVLYYGQTHRETPEHHVRRAQAFVLRSTPLSTVVWPGSFVEVDIPEVLDPECTLAVEPRFEHKTPIVEWPRPEIIEAIGGKVRLFNDTTEPQALKRNEHFCQVRLTAPQQANPNTSPCPDYPTVKQTKKPALHSDTVQLDPDHILPDGIKTQFTELHEKYDHLFDPNINGYNGAAGQFEANINMGPVQPPQRKGRVPQYARNNLVALQQKFDELETLGVFRKPEDIGVTAEYLNPSFLVKKQSDGFRLVTAFEDVGRYSKPQPSLMPDVDSTLRTIGQWKNIIKSDLTSAFYQIPLSKSSMKYCGFATPYRGVRVYTRCAMGMPGSETTLEELMCRVLGDCLQDGIVAKLADDLYCGGDSPTELLSNWSRVLHALEQCDLRLAPSKTTVCPRSTTILGWIWTQGSLSASPHRIAVLSSCNRPETVFGLRSFLGAYKMLARVIPDCSQVLAPLEDAVAGQQSKDRINWTDSLITQFSTAQSCLSSHKSIVLPTSSDVLWIVTDGSVSKRGIGATLYVMRNERLSLAGFFSAKLRKHQVTWLPCEIEALCIAAAVKHYSPLIIQSKHQACVLTDSKPCVQAIDKLSRGEFSASPRVTSFLAIVSRYQVSVRHLAGSANVPSDFASRNAPDCDDPRCQICRFIIETEDSVVRSVSIQDVIDKMSNLPFTTRSAWSAVQSECPDLRRTHAHLKQGTRPSKKITNVKDIKRYLNVASIAKDGLVVRRSDPLQPTAELIVVPRSVLDGLVTALHIKLDHPSRHQMQLVMKRHFYALDMNSVIDQVCESCHTCASLKKFPAPLVHQTSDDPPEAIGLSFAADILKQNRQLVLVLRETATSFTSVCFIGDEKRDTLRDALLRLSLDLHPLDGPQAVIRVDPAPCFMALRDDLILRKFRITLEIGRVKNINKNPVAEKAIGELEEELLRQEPGGGPVSELGLATAVARLNSRIRHSGLSARELWTQRSQFTHEQIPVSDRDIIMNQHRLRLSNHLASEHSKNKDTKSRETCQLCVGDLVYLYGDRNKSKARSRYLIVSICEDWCFIKKFAGSQLRSSSYKVKLSECYRVPCDISTKTRHQPTSTDDSDHEEDSSTCAPPSPVEIPPLLSSPSTDGHPPESAEFPILIGHYDNETDVPGSTLEQQEPQVTNETFECSDKAPKSGRPQRTRKPPQFLKDYITY